MKFNFCIIKNCKKNIYVYLYINIFYFILIIGILNETHNGTFVCS